MHDATRVIRAPLGPEVQGTPFSEGPVFAAHFHAAGDPNSIAYTYGRDHNPTWTALEMALGRIANATVCTFPSGLAACFAVIGSELRAGDTIVMPSDGYYTLRLLLKEHLQQLGITTRLVPTGDAAILAALDGARFLWLETPSNPVLEVCDIRRLAEAAHARGIGVAVDNTTATMLGQQPLDLGADYEVASDTKAMTGHGDVLFGHVATRDAARAAAIRAWRTHSGSIPGPMEAWLALRSLATLELRLSRQCANAQAIAEHLHGHRAVQSVRYPGLPSDPSHAIAARQMSHFGPVVSFTLRDQAAAERFLGASALITEATSFGSLHTTAERRARWGGDAVPPGFIRMSVGCEDVRDLLADLDQALAAAG